jgi:putative transposase
MLQDGARYHVTARANRKEMILDASPMKELFLSVVKRAKLKYRFRIDNFCIMGNHFHFIIQPARGESLSAIMRWILSVFAMAYNRIRNITGHVWGSRFFSRIVSGLRKLIQVFEYIDDNPLKANQVSSPWAWRFGGRGHAREGCREILDEKPEWLALLFPDHAPFLLH